MNTAAVSIATSPLVPWWVIGAFAGVAFLLIAFGIFRRARGVAWRTLAIAILLATLINPSLVEEKRDPQRDVAVIVADESPSQRIGERTRYTEAAVAHVIERLQAQKDLDFRVVRTWDYDLATIPMGSVLAQGSGDQVTLMTCSGSYTRSAGYDHRFVVRAQRI